MNYIYHVVLPASWEQQLDTDTYRHASLEIEGFIHFSYAHQLEGVLKRYYQGVPRVFILEVKPALLTARLVAETSTGGELYPHLFGLLNKSAINTIEERLL